MSNLFAGGDKVGCLEVYYLEERPERDEGPFVKEERDLINSITERLGRVIERMQAEEKLLAAFSEIKQLKNQLEEENIYLREQIDLKLKHEDIVAQSSGMKRAVYAAEQVAETNAAVLIMGNTGTGKGVIANYIHRISSRKNNPVVTVNCAALPSTLIEGEPVRSRKRCIHRGHDKTDRKV